MMIGAHGVTGVVRLGLILALTLLAGCSPKLSNTVSAGSEAYAVIPAMDPARKLEEYRIGPLDVIDVTVFQEPDLSLREAKVDASGQITMPLIGRVLASGRTTNELSAMIGKSLADKYLQNPQVQVAVRSAVSQRVAVEGSVNNPGVFELAGRTTLLESLALAKGTARTAALNQVVVFRTIDGKRHAAVFNVADIRRGASQDPEILGNDLVVVGFSNVKAGWRDFISASPLLGLFRAF